MVVNVPKIKTYIDSLDEKLYGGIPVNNIVLVSGEAGTMKSTLVFYALYQNAIKSNINSVYITLEQGRDSLLQHMGEIGLEYSDVKDKVSIIDLAMIRRNLENMGQQTWIQIFKMYAQNLKESLGYKILAIDSLNVLELIAEFQNLRNELFHFFEWLRSLDCTVFIISEIHATGSKYGTDGEEFLADGLLHLMMENVDGINIQRRIRIVKMRSSNHSPHYYSLIFENGKFDLVRAINE
ncbi:MAG: hypothetical protein M1481_04740 [Candidatus Thermoplasmatota archaeon]|jgi:KaiC/GvpD/RAD55 family RecA-like ATPase|nr:hypothetical protein [Candidatus Thermoplasmatota archaeon]MCL5963540.1 hypothetical protein [Candidatus Thermoplasmatota archaeon]